MNETHLFYGKRVAFTCALSQMTLEQAKQMLLECGGIYQTKATRNTNYLVVGDRAFERAANGKGPVVLYRARINQVLGREVVVLGEETFLVMG